MRANYKKNLLTGLAMIIGVSYIGLHLKDHENDFKSKFVPYSESLEQELVYGKVVGSTFRSNNGFNYAFVMYVRHDSNRVSIHYFEINDPTDEALALLKPGTDITINNFGQTCLIGGEQVRVLSPERIELALDSEF